MRLEQYVRDVLRDDKHKVAFPEALILSAELVGKFNSLYTKGERGACEYGRAMEIDEDYGSIVLSGEHHSEKYQSNMNIPDLVSDRYFGNVHSHPADSIGEGGGWAAHSMEDCLAVARQKDKRLFIGFVVTGPRIYAMAYRQGLTRIDASHIEDLRGKIASGLRTQYLAEAWNGDGNAYSDWQQRKWRQLFEEDLGENEINAAMEKARVEHKRSHAKSVGRLGQNLTISSCKELAEKDGFGFYISTAPRGGTGDRELTIPKEPSFAAKVLTVLWPF